MRNLLAATTLAWLLAACPGDSTPKTDTDPGTTDDSGTPPADTVAPVVTIALPENESTVLYDEYDEKTGLWYVDVTLEGTATDDRDGALSGGSLVWTTDLTTIQEADLGTGTTLVARLYSDDCFGVTHTLTLTATDSAGNAASTSVTVFIYTLC